MSLLPGFDPLSCTVGTGPNEINGSAAHDVYVQNGWTFLDKDQNPDTGFGVDETWLTVSAFGSSTAHFDIAAAAWADYSEIAIGFKVGQTGPIWAVFELPYLTTSGDWSTVVTGRGGGGGLSHVSMYGLQAPVSFPQTPPSAVPEPASLLLLGSGLTAVAAKLRRRRAGQVTEEGPAAR